MTARLFPGARLHFHPRPPMPHQDRVLVVGGGAAGAAALAAIRAERHVKATLVSASLTVTEARAGGGGRTGMLSPVWLAERTNEGVHAAAAACERVPGGGFRVALDGGGTLMADAVVACTGARAAMPSGHERVGITVRDASDVARLGEALRGARRVAVVGNGAIALELCHHILGPAGHGADVAWCCRDATPGDAYFDADASAFLLARLVDGKRERGTARPPPRMPAAGKGRAGARDDGPLRGTCMARAACRGVRGGRLRRTSARGASHGPPPRLRQRARGLERAA